MLTVEEGIDVAKAYLEQRNYEAGLSFTYNSDNEEFEI